MIDAPAVRACRPLAGPSALSTPAGLKVAMVVDRRRRRRVRDRRARGPHRPPCGRRRCGRPRPPRSCSTPRTSTSPSPTPTPPPRRSSCAPASSRPSCASATSTTSAGPATGWLPSPPPTSDRRGRGRSRDARRGTARLRRHGRGGAHEQPARAPGRRRLPAPGLGADADDDPAGGDDDLRGSRRRLDDRYGDGTAPRRRGPWRRPPASAVARASCCRSST